jgi:Flp pilus assembly protein TadD
MKKRVLLLLIPVPLIALAWIALSGSLPSVTRDHAAASNRDALPEMMSAHASSSDRDHEAKALLSELQKNPDHVPILLRLAQVSRDSGKLDDSLRYLREAVSQDPNNTDANLELGRALFETGDVTGAIQSTEHVLEISPKHADALYNLGAIYGNLSQDDRAREYWEKAAAVAPDSDGGRRAKENLQKLR